MTVGGNVNGNTGFIIDFFDLDRIVQPIIDEVDHRTLNYVEGLENPTAENIASWIFRRVNRAINVHAVRVNETRDCWANVMA